MSTTRISAGSDHDVSKLGDGYPVSPDVRSGPAQRSLPERIIEAADRPLLALALGCLTKCRIGSCLRAFLHHRMLASKRDIYSQSQVERSSSLSQAIRRLRQARRVLDRLRICIHLWLQPQSIWRSAPGKRASLVAFRERVSLSVAARAISQVAFDPFHFESGSIEMDLKFDSPKGQKACNSFRFVRRGLKGWAIFPSTEGPGRGLRRYVTPERLGEAWGRGLKTVRKQRIFLTGERPCSG